MLEDSCSDSKECVACPVKIHVLIVTSVLFALFIISASRS